MFVSTKSAALLSATVAVMGLVAVGRDAGDANTTKSEAIVAGKSREVTGVRTYPNTLAATTRSAVTKRDLPSMPVGTFGFHPVITYPAYHGAPRAVAVGDVSGDGRNDVVVANYLWTGSSLSIFLQSKEGALLSPIMIGFSGVGLAVTLADMDGDGAKDIVVGTESGLAVVFRPGESFVFRSYPAPTSIGSVAVLDLDSDGNMDVVGHSSGQGAVLFYGDGAGGLQQEFMATPAYTDNNIELGDVTGDDLPDMVLTQGSEPMFWVYPGNGEGAFDPAVQYTFPDSRGRPWANAIGDFNGDGKKDVAMSEVRFSGFLHIYPQEEGGLLGSSFSIASEAYPQWLVSADLDRNGFDDLVAVHQSGAVGYFLQSESGMGSEIILPGASPSFNDPDSLTVGDISSDGYPDILVATPSYLRVYKGRGPWCRTGKPTVCPQ